MGVHEEIQMIIEKEALENEVREVISTADQINLLALILEELILEIPEGERTALQQQGLAVFEQIKQILNQ